MKAFDLKLPAELRQKALDQVEEFLAFPATCELSAPKQYKNVCQANLITAPNLKFQGIRGEVTIATTPAKVLQ